MQAQLKQPTVRARGTIEPAIPTVLNGLSAQLDHPQVAQREGYQEPRQTLWDRDVVFVHVEASALLVREERLDLKATPGCFFGQFQAGHQRHALFGELPDQSAGKRLKECPERRAALRFGLVRAFIASLGKLVEVETAIPATIPTSVRRRF